MISASAAPLPGQRPLVVPAIPVNQEDVVMSWGVLTSLPMSSPTRPIPNRNPHRHMPSCESWSGIFLVKSATKGLHPFAILSKPPFSPFDLLSSCFYPSSGASDMWSGLVTTELNHILSSPLDMNSWCKFMMLAKCVLFNPSGRQRSWCDTLRIVKDRAMRWSEGDFTSFWVKVIAEESRASHKLRKTNLSTYSEIQQCTSRPLSSSGWSLKQNHLSSFLQWSG